MTKEYRFLYIDDQSDNNQTFLDSIAPYNEQSGNPKIVGEVLEIRDDSSAESICNLAISKHRKVKYDAIIIDLKLDNGTNSKSTDTSGNNVIEEIVKTSRIPVAVYSGTVDSDLASNSFVPKGLQFKRGGEGVDFSQIFTELLKHINSGVYKVLQNGGEFDKIINEVFWHAINTNIEKWMEYEGQGKDIEKIITRLASAYIPSKIESTDNIQYLPEEVLLTPLNPSKIKCGAIYNSTTNIWIVVLNPPCDLECNKHENVVFCEIDPFELLDGSSEETRKMGLTRIMGNSDNNSLFQHSLPARDDFNGGRINFRKLFSMTKEEFSTKYPACKYQIADSFISNIQDRLTVYMSRQGQPALDVNSTYNTLNSDTETEAGN